MKVKVFCQFHNRRGEKIAEPGEYVESSSDVSVSDLQRLINGGSAVLVEPPRKSERD